MDARRFRALNPYHRALVAVAVLLDGREAPMFLENDTVHGVALKRAALDLTVIDPELRMPLVGTLLRTSVIELIEEDERKVRN